MRFTTIVLAGLALAGNALGAQRQRLNNNAIRGNASGLTDDEDILGDFHLPYTEDITEIFSEATSLATDMSHHGPNDPVPFWNLPQCYKDCIQSNCCNGWPSLGDVKKLTIHEWCHSKWIPAQNWIADHLQWCIKDACKDCRPKCRDDSSVWQRETCAEGRS